MRASMIKQTPQTAEVRYELEAEGFRMTKLRSALLEIFAHEVKPFSADEILTKLQKNNITVHKVTLYRELEVLVAAQIINPIYFHDRISRYEFTEHGHHHHVVCTSCGKVADIEAPDRFNTFEHKIAQQTAFTHIRHSLEFFGLCQNCSPASR